MTRPEETLGQAVAEGIGSRYGCGMRHVVPAAVTYFAVVFAAAFVLGTLRVLVIVPHLGPLVAVVLELPLVLAISWVVAGRVLRRWPVGRAGRLAIGVIAFGLLMLAELALAVFAFGQTPGQFVVAMTTLQGGLGLAGQTGFAAVPVLRK